MKKGILACMLPYSNKEAIECITGAPNMNSAIKGFLRNEVQKGDPIAKFIKSLKTTVASKNPDALPQFIEKALPKYEVHLFLITRHAYHQATDEILDNIISTYAEAFNETFSITGEEIHVSDRARFETIAKNAIEQMGTSLKENDLYHNGFMLNAIIYSLFEGPVIKELRPLFN